MGEVHKRYCGKRGGLRISETRSQSRYRLREYVVSHIDRVEEPLERDVYPLFTNFVNLPINIGIDTLIKCMISCRLLPNDALIVATCQRHGITAIATFDEDFRRVPWLRVVLRKSYQLLQISMPTSVRTLLLVEWKEPSHTGWSGYILA